MPSESGYIRLRVASTSGPVMPSLKTAMLTDGDDRGRAVTEQRAAHEAGHRWLGRRKHQRTQLDGHQRGDIVGCAAQIVVHPRDARSAGHAAQAEDRHPTHIGPQTKPGSDAGIQRRHRYTGHRRRDDQIDVAGLQARVLERARQGRAAQFYCVLDEKVVCFAEVAQRQILIDRKDEVPVR